jgi:hypothetical protein
MAGKNGTAIARADANDSEVAEKPRSAIIASVGLSNSRKTKEFLSALIGDVMNDNVATKTATVAVNATRQLLRVVELEHKYGRPESQDKVLAITEQAADPLAAEEEELRGRLATIEAARAKVTKPTVKA